MAKKKTDKERRGEAELQCSLSRMQIYKLRKITDAYEHPEKREILRDINVKIYDLLDELDFHLKRG